MEYLLKASAVVVIFYLCYKLFLQRDTFFVSNRSFLLAGLISAFLIPFIVIPVYVERSPILFDNLPLDTTNAITQTTGGAISLIDIAFYIYIAGVILFLGKFLIQLISLLTILIKNQGTKRGRYTYIKTSSASSPFSFFNWIVYNPDLFNKSELEQILTHEKVHAYQHHSIDILLTQLACIVLWFNPFMWLYNKDLKQNLEFIADQNAQCKTSCKKSYQYTLLKTSMPTHQLALTNNFYNSLIKKRIVMLHKSKSKKRNQLKYLLILPLLGLFIMSFATKEIFINPEDPFYEDPSVALNSHEGSSEHMEQQSASNDLRTVENKGDIEVFIIAKNFTESELNKIVNTLKEKGITARFKGIKRNDKDEIIAIKITLNSKHSNANYNISSDDAIKPIKITFKDHGKNITIGSSGSHLSHKSDYVVEFKDKKREHRIIKPGKARRVIIHSDDENHDIHTEEEIEIISHDDEEHTIEVIVETEGLGKEEDIIIIKEEEGEATPQKMVIRKAKKEHKGDKITIVSDDDEEPLYIIDGEEAKQGIKELSPEAIESINVLKGDAAIKKYGDKGKNGVIDIKTKKEK
ncbi:M56 family metallopeptidase [Tamlana sp. 2201CG12-4]|uniref:M56 family metallopeptidase n=1 Tax=Tamlana sp. 2201CG12-4 TaxID=3112582 RepID=UPI002DBA67DB|nr:M56 family metallopeptidase [Tamlana sp. 2201CG12-4]MEC3907524.1 M56 family metallopeptidase [Tamlana sp. 2201CG12-4]